MMSTTSARMIGPWTIRPSKQSPNTSASLQTIFPFPTTGPAGSQRPGPPVAPGPNRIKLRFTRPRHGRDVTWGHDLSLQAHWSIRILIIITTILIIIIKITTLNDTDFSSHNTHLFILFTIFLTLIYCTHIFPISHFLITFLSRADKVVVVTRIKTNLESWIDTPLVKYISTLFTRIRLFYYSILDHIILDQSLSAK